VEQDYGRSAATLASVSVTVQKGFGVNGRGALQRRRVHAADQAEQPAESNFRQCGRSPFAALPVLAAAPQGLPLAGSAATAV